jgi:hypothetical protein
MIVSLSRCIQPWNLKTSFRTRGFSRKLVLFYDVTWWALLFFSQYIPKSTFLLVANVRVHDCLAKKSSWFDSMQKKWYWWSSTVTIDFQSKITPYWYITRIWMYSQNGRRLMLSITRMGLFWSLFCTLFY